jgi:hypothetical protein
MPVNIPQSPNTFIQRLRELIGRHARQRREPEHLEDHLSHLDSGLNALTRPMSNERDARLEQLRIASRSEVFEGYEHLAKRAILLHISTEGLGFGDDGWGRGKSDRLGFLGAAEDSKSASLLGNGGRGDFDRPRSGSVAHEGDDVRVSADLQGEGELEFRMLNPRSALEPSPKVNLETRTTQTPAQSYIPFRV